MDYHKFATVMVNTTNQNTFMKSVNLNCGTCKALILRWLFAQKQKKKRNGKETKLVVCKLLNTRIVMWF